MTIKTDLFKKMITSLGLFALVLMFTGCAGDSTQFKDETDQAVYDIIDNKWQPEFGSANNYRISDSEKLPGDIVAGDYISMLDILTLPNAVALATASNRQYQTEKEAVYLAAIDLTEARHIYEPNPFFWAQGGYLDDSDGTRLGAETGLGFQQLMATGAQVGTSIGLGWLDVISGDARSGFTTILNAAVRQPLLRGANRKVVMEQLTQADRDTLYQIRAFNRFRKEFVISVITDYYRVLQIADQLENNRNDFYTLTVIHRRAKDIADSGKIPRHELQQAQQGRLKSFDRYIQSQKDYKEAIDQFKMLMALSPEVELSLDVQEIDILLATSLKPVDCDEKFAIEMAVEQRLDLANESDKVIDAERKIEVALDATGAELDIIGTADRNIFSGLPGDSDRTREQYEVSLELDVGLDRLQEKNDYRRSLIALNQQKRNNQQAIDTVTLEVKQVYRDLMEAQKRYQIQKSSLELAKKRTENSFLLLQYNRANTRDVLDAQDDLLDAKNETTGALVDYTVAMLNFYRDTGMLYVKPDGMWQKTGQNSTSLRK